MEWSVSFPGRGTWVDEYSICLPPSSHTLQTGKVFRVTTPLNSEANCLFLMDPTSLPLAHPPYHVMDPIPSSGRCILILVVN